jgi:pimeloyl-ACP methyl ester carboxylesterase
VQADRWRESGEWFSWQGHRIFHRVEGAGPWLLLVHGFPTASWDWHRIWPALVDRYRVVALDLLGYGFSDKPRSHRYRTADQADLVEALLARLGVAEATVLAHDYGDTVVQELLARHREGRPGFGIPGVCFLNGGLFYEAIRPRPIQRLLLSPLGPLLSRFYTRGAFDRSIRSIFGPDSQPSPDDLDSLWSLVTHNGGQRVIHRLIRYLPERAAKRERWVGAITNGDVPLRFINGLADPVSGRAMAERYRELVPRADLTLLDRIGHFPQLEAPRKVVESFLEIDGSLRG